MPLPWRNLGSRGYSISSFFVFSSSATTVSTVIAAAAAAAMAAMISLLILLQLLAATATAAVVTAVLTASLTTLPLLIQQYQHCKPLALCYYDFNCDSQYNNTCCHRLCFLLLLIAIAITSSYHCRYITTMQLLLYSLCCRCCFQPLLLRTVVACSSYTRPIQLHVRTAT